MNLTPNNRYKQVEEVNQTVVRVLRLWTAEGSPCFAEKNIGLFSAYSISLKYHFCMNQLTNKQAEEHITLPSACTLTVNYIA